MIWFVRAKDLSPVHNLPFFTATPLKYTLAKTTWKISNHTLPLALALLSRSIIRLEKMLYASIAARNCLFVGLLGEGWHRSVVGYQDKMVARMPVLNDKGEEEEGEADGDSGTQVTLKAAVALAQCHR